ncbi:MAG TPA: amino acid adenylation domain-containing protein, partial [Blastocatellia bacterium]|nr:amino acid adenylation domain-containing protein [Blastocatellia bacterium]
AWALVLSKYSGQQDVVFGATMSGRPATLEGCEAMIGLFINTLPVRMRVEGDRGAVEWLRQVQGEQVELREYEYSPLVQVQGWSEVPRGTALFDSILVFENYIGNDTPSKQVGLAIKVNHSVEKTNYPITAFAVAGPRITIGIAHYTARFDADLVAGMLKDFKAIFENIAAHPERTLIEIMPTAAQTQTEFDPSRDSNLTRNQLLIWAGQKLQPHVPLYNMAHAYTIHQEIEPELFQRAFQEVINDADALRIVIEEVEGIPQQRFVAEFPYQMDYFDLSGLADPHGAFETWARERIQVMFDLSERLFDSVLIKLSERRFVWYLNIHDINTDGWAHSVIFQRMSQHYGRLLGDVTEDLTPLPPFESHTRWEQEYRTSPQYLESEAYWDRKLQEKIEPVTFYGKGAVKQETRIERVRCDLGQERSQQLKAIASKEAIFTKTLSVSLFNIFAAVLLTYAYRHSGNRRLSIGAPFHNRRSEEVKDVVGLLMSVLPLMVDIEEGETFLSLIRKVADAASEALRHCRYAISNPLQGRIYEVMLNYQTSLFANFNGAQVETEWIHSGHGNDSLVLQVQEFDRTGSLVLYFDFHCSVFDEQARSQTVDHFVNLIDALLQDCDRRIDRADFLSEEEKRRAIVEFNQTQAPLPEDQTISGLFESQAERTPDQVALKCEDVSLTYAELNARANQLAHYLRGLGVGPETAVGICLEQRPELMVGILGILKAGGAYVPLDPLYPKQRLAYIVEDARMPVIVTREGLASNLPRDGAKTICLDTQWPAIAELSRANPPGAAQGENLAYVIYSSGSTGAPKGILVTQKSVINHNLYIIGRANLRPADRVLQFHSISFDAAVEEIFPTWLSGATLVMRGDRLLTAGELLRLIKRERVSVLDLPTAYWHEWVTELATSNEELPESLRLLIVGGEKASPERFNLWQQLGGNRIEWFDGYGPTETTIIATLYSAPENESKAMTLLPIGRPIANTRLYVLDGQLQAAPPGLPGQLHVSGAGLARGYLSRPDLTATKFIPDPFSTSPGSRLYSTGDLGRLLASGEVEFLGRIDDQVKVRGFRIEPGEIESALLEDETLAQALVVARQDGGLDRRLVAYVVAQEGRRVDPSRLREHLRRRLPDYMQPSAIVELDRLPLNANGKVDRRALPEPARQQAAEQGRWHAPRDGYELEVASIFEQVLGVGRVGVEDNFFELGGHS